MLNMFQVAVNESVGFFTHFLPMIPFYTLWKHPRKPLVFRSFLGVYNGNISQKWIKKECNAVFPVRKCLKFNIQK